jgi:hypothetical protein
MGGQPYELLHEVEVVLVLVAAWEMLRAIAEAGWPVTATMVVLTPF